MFFRGSNIATQARGPGQRALDRVASTSPTIWVGQPGPNCFTSRHFISDVESVRKAGLWPLLTNGKDP